MKGKEAMTDKEILQELGVDVEQVDENELQDRKGDDEDGD